MANINKQITAVGVTEVALRGMCKLIDKYKTRFVGPYLNNAITFAFDDTDEWNKFMEEIGFTRRNNETATKKTKSNR